MDTSWGLYIQGSEFPILVGLLAIFVILPLGLIQAKKGHNAILVALKDLAAELRGEFIYKPFVLGKIVDIFKDPDCAEYEIKFKLNGRDCMLFPYAYPSHSAGRNKLTNFAPWATVFKLKLNQYSKNSFSFKYAVRRSLFSREAVDFKEANIIIDSREFFDQVANYENLVNFVKDIRFTSNPFFEMKLAGDLIYIKVDKVESKIEDVRKYINLIEIIAKNVETRPN